MILRAYVGRQERPSIHHLGILEDGQIKKTEELPPAAWVEIHESDGMFSLIRYSCTGSFAGDTGHFSLEEAKRQAAAEFDIQENEWEPVKE